MCSDKRDASGNPMPIVPGCGGFGIRNFLTLFLSIEVSKADDGTSEVASMSNLPLLTAAHVCAALSAALAAGDESGASTARAMISVFTSQLDASNP